MRSIRQQIKKAIANGTLVRPCVYIPPGFEPEVYQQRRDASGEHKLTLETAEVLGLITVERGYFGHWNTYSECRLWVHHNSVSIWLKPITTNNNINR